MEKDNTIEGSLIFEGGYLNEKRNGKGKEYFRNGKLNFEGEYFYDKKLFGKAYNLDGNLDYNMDKLDENLTGIRTEYNPNSYNFRFEGEYLNGKRNGKGKEYDIRGRLYLKVYIQMEKKMDKGKNIILMAN